MRVRVDYRRGDVATVTDLDDPKAKPVAFHRAAIYIGPGPLAGPPVVEYRETEWGPLRTALVEELVIGSAEEKSAEEKPAKRKGAEA
jgi:hypothetical protein